MTAPIQILIVLLLTATIGCSTRSPEDQPYIADSPFSSAVVAGPDGPRIEIGNSSEGLNATDIVFNQGPFGGWATPDMSQFVPAKNGRIERNWFGWKNP